MSFKLKSLLIFTVMAFAFAPVTYGGESPTSALKAKDLAPKKPAPLTMTRTYSNTTKKYIYEVKGGTAIEKAAMQKRMTSGGNCSKAGSNGYVCNNTYSANKAATTVRPSSSVATQPKKPVKKPTAKTSTPKNTGDAALSGGVGTDSSGTAAETDTLNDDARVQELIDAADARRSSLEEGDTTGCVEKFSNLAQACTSNVGRAGNSCNKDSDTNKGMFGQFASSAATITQQLASLSASSVALACSDIGKLSAAASNTLNSFKGKCEEAQTACVDRCENYLNSLTACINQKADGDLARILIESYTEDVTNDLQTCRSYDSQIAQADQSLQGTVGSMNNAANCENAVAGDDFCKSNPTNPACANNKIVESCANEEYAKTNLTCICLKNPAAEGCGLNAGGATGTGPSGGLIPLPGSTDPDTSDLIDENGNAIAPVAGNGGAGEELSGQKGGGSGGLEGSGGGPGGPDSRGGFSKDGIAGILSGFFGGGSGSSAGTAGSGNGVPGTAGAKGIKGGLGNPDLRKFMPGGLNDPRRGPASSHGINARDADLFKIIKNAYVKQTKSLKD